MGSNLFCEKQYVEVICTDEIPGLGNSISAKSKNVVFLSSQNCEISSFCFKHVVYIHMKAINHRLQDLYHTLKREYIIRDIGTSGQ